MKNILIVEDDINIAKMIKTTVSIGNYESTVCYEGTEALTLINSGEFDLILLDIMLPGMDGFDIISKKTSNTPLIFITARQELEDKVNGLKLGAEDYIVKPFEAMELLARIEVVFRRFTPKPANRILQYEDIALDTTVHTCYKNGEKINLTPREFELFEFFLTHQDIAISRQQLLKALWGYEFEGESRTVDIHVQQLRKKLDIKNKLVTIPKLGYRLNQENTQI